MNVQMYFTNGVYYFAMIAVEKKERESLKRLPEILKVLSNSL